MRFSLWSLDGNITFCIQWKALLMKKPYIWLYIQYCQAQFKKSKSRDRIGLGQTIYLGDYLPWSSITFLHFLWSIIQPWFNISPKWFWYTWLLGLTISTSSLAITCNLITSFVLHSWVTFVNFICFYQSYGDAAYCAEWQPDVKYSQSLTELSNIQKIRHTY